MTSPNVGAEATPRVTFHTCLHDDGDAMWLQFEGGAGGLAPEMLRLVRGGEVLETRPCIPMPAGRRSHARPDRRRRTPRLRRRRARGRELGPRRRSGQRLSFRDEAAEIAVGLRADPA